LRKYIKQGIEDWQKPLKRQVLKNAILPKTTKEQDPDFGPEGHSIFGNSLCGQYNP
jgi:hypothetical protein